MTYMVFVAGTFNVLTDGHKKLLRTAVENTEGFRHLMVFITRGAWVQKEVPVRDWEWRKDDVLSFLTGECGMRPSCVEIVPISSPCGNPCAMPVPGITDVLVCSSETRAKAEECISTIPEDRRPRVVVVERDPSMPSSTQIIKTSIQGVPARKRTTRKKEATE